MRKEKQKYANYVYECEETRWLHRIHFCRLFLVDANYLSVSEGLYDDLEQKTEVHVLCKEDLQKWESLVSANRSH